LGFSTWKHTSLHHHRAPSIFDMLHQKSCSLSLSVFLPCQDSGASASAFNVCIAAEDLGTSGGKWNGWSNLHKGPNLQIPFFR
jgi:hypothetical protein